MDQFVRFVRYPGTALLLCAAVLAPITARDGSIVHQFAILAMAAVGLSEVSLALWHLGRRDWSRRSIAGHGLLGVGCAMMSYSIYHGAALIGGLALLLILPGLLMLAQLVNTRS